MSPPDGVAAASREAQRFVDSVWDPQLTVREWWSALAAAGLGFPQWPDGLGGRGWGPEAARTVRRVLAAAGTLGPPSGLGTTMGGPVVAAFGTRDQQERFLPPLARGEESWCQLFSEPGAGSDLAGLTTRAERDGEHWVVTGQKVWTSGAQVADRGMLVARTDPHVPKHRGLSYFVIPMDQPGVVVRPLRQMTGETHFNEVFLDAAVVPAQDLIGKVGGGWALTVATLTHERGDMGDGDLRLPSTEAGERSRGRTGATLDVPAGRAIERSRSTDARDARRFTTATALVHLAAERGRLHDPVLRDRLARQHVLDEVAGFTTLRSATSAHAGRPPGPDASVAKLAWSQRLRMAGGLAVEVLGAAGMLDGDDAPERGDVQLTLLSVPATSIAGGTDEVQRNLIGERALGLPREAAIGRDVPFTELTSNS